MWGKGKAEGAGVWRIRERWGPGKAAGRWLGGSVTPNSRAFSFWEPLPAGWVIEGAAAIQFSHCRIGTCRIAVQDQAENRRPR